MTAPTEGRAIGAPRPRIEGPLKVTGAARYSADNAPPDALHATLVGAPVCQGRIVDVDASAALAVEGVVRILTWHDLPTFGPVPPWQAAVLNLPMQSDRIQHEGEPVAIVLATDIQAAEQARTMVTVRCAPTPPVLPGQGRRNLITASEEVDESGLVEGERGAPFRIGDVDAALASSAVRVSETWIQPSRHHNFIETSGTVARWDGDLLTVWDSAQASFIVPNVIAAALQLDPGNIRVIAPHVGGGFGGKGWVWPHQILAAAAARIVDRPVKLHLGRADQYTSTGFQPLLDQFLELGATEDGRLTALRHQVSNITSMTEVYVEAATEVKDLYACPAIDVSQSVEPVTVNLPTPMRTTNEGCGLWPLESAMNELAHRLGVDPIEIRLRNHADREPTTGRAWSTKHLREAYEEGARLFGWYSRPRGGRSEGNWRIGTGMASSTMGQIRFPGNATVVLQRDGDVVVRVDIQDIGTGLQTLLAQVAAEELGTSVEAVRVEWGDSDLPSTGPMYAGSGTVANTSAVALACRDIRKQLGEHSDTDDVLDALRQTDLPQITGDGRYELPNRVPMDMYGGDSGYAIRSFGAVFAEVAVDPELGIMRMRRMVGVYDCGRVMNARTARSQMIGSLVWAWGKSALERSELDPTTARWMSKNLSSVHIPVNADISDLITIAFIDEPDPYASVTGARAMGEIGATGADAAIAEAVFDAIGVRFRELPITPKRILDALAEMGR
ncbi:xanthine dehydrogenase family protein molybdopterin-binding subunit [Pseudonocardia kujensis]|uniref:xanthine dehydrogenase family protein molybdopterin-binding subunit n=1 Tax=Pseudonocardia kujensis TaxID=1128675 RepID=UPI001E2EC107|nr:xanthine dehydrogenase family protein molybdopterin-binding subunit [Pseudonocardia kujensis]MCE0767597.1 xanthine dehydrogenase family protein molybdopterin-binding subunit [Pseudonocardia kujensis]